MDLFAKEKFPGDKKRRVILHLLGGIIVLLICKATGIETFWFIGSTGETAPETALGSSPASHSLVE